MKSIQLHFSGKKESQFNIKHKKLSYSSVTFMLSHLLSVIKLKKNMNKNKRINVKHLTTLYKCVPMD